MLLTWTDIMVCIVNQPRPRSPGCSEEEWTQRETGQKQVDCGFSDAVEFFLVRKLHEGEHRDSTKANQLPQYPHIVLTSSSIIPHTNSQFWATSFIPKIDHFSVNASFKKLGRVLDALSPFINNVHTLVC